MTSGRNMEIALHFVSLQTTVDPARLQAIPAKPSGRLFELPLALLPPDLSNNVFRMRVFLFFSLPPSIFTVERVQPLVIDPLVPIGAVFGQCVSGQDAVA